MTIPLSRRCVICDNESKFRLKKEMAEYFQCDNCKTLFCDAINQEGMVGGEHEIGRNETQNHIRIARVDEMIFGSKKEDVKILDFGTGHGMLVRDLKEAGYPNVDGYDAYNEEFNQSIPKRNNYHIITMIECAEHLSSPFLEFDVIFRALLPGGAIMIETSFTNIAEQDGIPLEEFFYIAPQNGHSTIYSHHGLDLLMATKGFVPRQHFNRHVRLFQKPYNK